MNIKKIATLLLIIVAALIWGNNILLVIKGKPEYTKQTKTVVHGNSDNTTQNYKYVSNFRDPFLCKYIPQSHVVKNKVKLLKNITDKTEKVVLPPCSIGGIVYNSNNPMALFAINKKSILVKQGDVVDSVCIKKIENNSMLVVFKGQEFLLKK